MGFPPASEYNQTAQNTVTAQSLGVNEAIMARQNRSKRRPGKTGGREGGEADHGLLCSPETLSRWHPSMDTEAEAIQSSPRFFLVPFSC
jgi:hypothetical protein